MKSFKKLAALILVLVMVTGAASGMITSAADAGAGDIVILHTNDIHSRVDGFADVAGAKAYYEGLGASVILLDAGDTLHGFPIANLSYGSNIVDIMNAVGYDAMVPGNHDFNYTASRLIELADEMDFPLLSANYVDDSTGSVTYVVSQNDHLWKIAQSVYGTGRLWELLYNYNKAAIGADPNLLFSGMQIVAVKEKSPVFDPYTIIEAAGRKIGIIGISTPETKTKSSPVNTDGFSFSEDNLAETVQKQIDALKAQECDYIIALGHLGIDKESAPWRSVDVIAGVTGLDLFIDGHSHSSPDAIKEAGFSAVKDKAGKDVILTSSGQYIENIGMVTISGGKITAGVVGDEIKPDADIADMIGKLNDGIKPLLDTVVAKTSASLVAARAPGNRTEETNLGNLCTDAFRWKTGADVALTNGGGIRDSAGNTILGDITYGIMNLIYPFGNVVVKIEISGADILAALEHGTSALPGASGGFPQVSGMTFTVDTAKTANRVSDVMIGGQPLDLAKTYTLATNDFTQIGGDGYDMLAKYSVTGYYGALDEVLVEYVSTVLGGTIGADYAAPEGRIKIVS